MFCVQVLRQNREDAKWKSGGVTGQEWMRGQEVVGGVCGEWGEVVVEGRIGGGEASVGVVSILSIASIERHPFRHWT